MRGNPYRLMISTANCLAVGFLKRLSLRNFVNTALKPVDYTRSKEVPALLDVSDILGRKDEKIRIIDIGSPQILSLSLSRYSSLWDIVYINAFKPELDDLEVKSMVLGLSNLKILKADVTDLDTLKGLGEFDYVLSCSVFEHIHPEDGGDTVAARNIKSLLKPGGVFAFSVPYYKKAFNEYVEGDVYSVKGEKKKRTFFQRFYDEGTLTRQIISPSGLELFDKLYIGERFYFEKDIHRRMAFFVGVKKRSFLLGRFFHIISSVFMTKSQNYKTLKKPYLAIYSLVKPRG